MDEPFTPLDPDAQLGYLLVRVADQVSRSWLALLRRHGINPRQFSVLSLLAVDAELSQAELARRVFITPQSMSESLAGLVDAGFVVRDDVERGRAARLRLTVAGRRLLKKAYPLVEQSNRDSFAALNSSERAELARLFHKLLG